MLGNVLRNSDGNYDAGDIRERPAGGGNLPARSPAPNLVRGRVQTERPGGARHQPNVNRDGYGYSRQRRPDRLSKGKVIVTVSWTQYIPHSEVEYYERLGWTITDALTGTHHGVHSVLGTWRSDVPNAT